MLPERRVSTHPGEMLSEDFLKPEGISQAAFARHIGIDPVVISEIVNGKRGLSPEMCFKFSAAFGNSAEFWWSLQCAHDLTAAREKLRKAGRLPKSNILPTYAAAIVTDHNGGDDGGSAAPKPSASKPKPTAKADAKPRRHTPRHALGAAGR